MGAFLLFPKSRKDLDLPAVEQHFRRRGFGKVHRYAFAGLELWLLAKQKTADCGIWLENGQCRGFVVGTVAYRQRTSGDSLKLLADDYEKGSVAWDQLFGSFCLGLNVEKRVVVLTDQLECQSVFVDAKLEVACSSFLGLLMALPGRHKLNQLGIAEKLATGYIVGPDTLVEGIIRVTRRVEASWSGRYWEFAKKPARLFDPAEFQLDPGTCLDEQIRSIERCLAGLQGLSNGSRAVLGLSTGYDSRLLFAVASRMGFPVAVQTHCTKGVHDFDRREVEKVAAQKGVPFISVPTKPMDALTPEQFAAVVMDCVDFFDGRCSHNMGAFSETYTRQYSMDSLGTHSLRLNGLGGELYRNYYFDNPKPVNFRSWLERHVYYPTAKRVIPDTFLWEEMHRHKVRKMSDELQLDLTKTATALDRKRYYCEIRMPQCDGANNNAHNQIAYYATPFIEWNTIRAGYRCVPHLGISGQFQASLIRRADAQLASMPSHYGFTLTKEPLRYQVKSWIKCSVPDALWVARRQRKLAEKAFGAGLLEKYNKMRQKNSILLQVEEAFRSWLPKYEWSEAQRHYAQGPTALFVGSWLLAYGHKVANP